MKRVLKSQRWSATEDKDGGRGWEKGVEGRGYLGYTNQYFRTAKSVVYVRIGDDNSNQEHLCDSLHPPHLQVCECEKCSSTRLETPLFSSTVLVTRKGRVLEERRGRRG